MIDYNRNKFNLVDISKIIVPDGTEDRPFAIRKGYLHDGTYKFDVYNTHTHVGTHVECSSHFFDEGKSVDMYELDNFCGRGIMLHAELSKSINSIDKKYVENNIGDIIREGDIVVCRNNDENDADSKKFFTEDAAIYFKEKKVKMIALGPNISLGTDIENQRRFHDILIENTVLLENIDNMHKITKREFYVMAFPILIKGIDSAWCRAVVFEEKDMEGETE